MALSQTYRPESLAGEDSHKCGSKEEPTLAAGLMVMRLLRPNTNGKICECPLAWAF